MSMNLPKREELSLRIVLASSALTASSQSIFERSKNSKGHAAMPIAS